MTKQYIPFIIERTFDAPVDLVWKSLTDITLLKQWLPFFPDFKAEVGFETRFLLGSDPEHQYLHIVEVKDVIEGKKLTHTWRYDGYEGNSLITYELFPEGNATSHEASHIAGALRDKLGGQGKTRVRLTFVITEPFPKDNPDFAESNFKEGWTYTIEGLGKFVEKQK